MLEPGSFTETIPETGSFPVVILAHEDEGFLRCADVLPFGVIGKTRMIHRDYLQTPPLEDEHEYTN